MADNEFLSRTRLLFGDEALQAFQSCRIAVMGLGGVGSYAAEALVRSGISRFLLVDFDRITASNLNRQLPALQSTLGQQKTDVMEARMLDINPNAEIETFSGFFNQESQEKLLQGLDFIVDAIDSLGPKAGLLEAAYRREIPVISVMGAASRFDPSRIELADISRSRICPLARKVRKYLHRRGIRSGIPVIFSTEKPIAQFDFEEGSDKDWFTDQGRKRGTLGSVVYMPAIMGMWAAAFVLRKLAEKL